MKFIGDFHIHSHYSRATSKNLNAEYLDYWARMKGINVVGTGDITHPKWIQELKEKFVEAEEGLFRLQQKFVLENNVLLDNTPFPRFMLTGEISSIYKKNGKVRKIHNVVCAPDFVTVDKIQARLVRLGANITSDGRPILGLDSRNLLELCLEANENILFFPAHIWTPWFAVLGDKSGFDSIEECFEDLTKHIHVVETGLSSDPPMNERCSFLDNYMLISNSDAHSPEKLGREANLFDTELSYPSIFSAWKKRDRNKFLGTLEFFPQEGKYHHDGHRKCNISWTPEETKKHKEICSVCAKPITVGVMNRVMQLADRKNNHTSPIKHPFFSIIPLKEILSELKGVSPQANKITVLYLDVLKKLGPELVVLRETPLEEIKKSCGEELGEAIKRMRNGKVHVVPGYDGEYGRITVFAPAELSRLGPQASLFDEIHA